MTTLATYPLRLPRSIKVAAQTLANAEGISMNQFIATAVAEKLSVLNTVNYFEERRARADRSEYLRILNRQGGQVPRAGDEVFVKSL